MREKILAQLVSKFPGVSKKFLGLWADKLTPKVTEESQIQGVIDELDKLPIPITDLATEFQKEGDTRVTEAEKKWLKNPPKKDDPKTDPTPKKEGDTTTDDAPAWAKSLIESNQKLSQTVENLQKEKTQSTIREKISSNEKLKEVPAVLWNKRALPEKEEDVEAFIEDVVKDHTAFTQDLADKGFAQVSKPVVGTPAKAGGGQEKVSTDMQAYLNEKKAAREKDQGQQKTA
jgi:hypothetical protein